MHIIVAKVELGIFKPSSRRLYRFFSDSNWWRPHSVDVIYSLHFDLEIAQFIVILCMPDTFVWDISNLLAFTENSNSLYDVVILICFCIRDTARFDTVFFFFWNWQ